MKYTPKVLHLHRKQLYFFRNVKVLLCSEKQNSPQRLKKACNNTFTKQNAAFNCLINSAIPRIDRLLLRLKQVKIMANSPVTFFFVLRSV